MLINNKKAEMGIGTLILFIAFILVAAVAASVLISTTSTLQSKALNTGKQTTDEVGTSMTSVQIYAEDASNNGVDKTVDYFYYTIKLSAGSEPIRFADVLLTMNTNNNAQDYTYLASYSGYTINLSGACTGGARDPTPVVYTRTMTGSCDDFPLVNVINVTLINSTGSTCPAANNTYMNVSVSSSQFVIDYSLSSSQQTEGYIFPGDVVKMCFTAPRAIGEAEAIKINLVPKIGSALIVDTTMPSLMRDKRIYIFP